MSNNQDTNVPNTDENSIVASPQRRRVQSEIEAYLRKFGRGVYNISLS